MEKTKYRNLEKSDQVMKLLQPPLALPTEEGKPLHDLPDPRGVKVNPVDLSEAINNRVSVRAYNEEPLSLDELSYVLWSTQGVKEVTKRPATLRTVPSAGSRHCFETYVLVNRVDGLKPGLYRFIAIDHKLQEIDMSDDIAERVTQGCFGQRFVLSSAITLILTAVREEASRRRYELETGLELDVDDYVEKPVSPEFLLKRVDKLTRKKKKT